MTITSCRIIVGRKCNFSCSYCCNETMPTLMEKFKPISQCDISDIIEPYQDVIITGGEPLVPANIRLTLSVMRTAYLSHKTVYVYTNLSHFPNSSTLTILARCVTGWTIGVHRQSVNLVENLERLVHFGGQRIRVVVEQSQAKHFVDLVKHLPVEIKPYILDDCDISDREDWYIVEK